MLLGSSCCPVSTNYVQNILHLRSIPPVAWDEIWLIIISIQGCRERERESGREGEREREKVRERVREREKESERKGEKERERGERDRERER